MIRAQVMQLAEGIVSSLNGSLVLNADLNAGAFNDAHNENVYFLEEVERALCGDVNALTNVFYNLSVCTAKQNADGAWHKVPDDAATQAVRMVLQPFLPQVFGV